MRIFRFYSVAYLKNLYIFEELDVQLYKYKLTVFYTCRVN